MRTARPRCQYGGMGTQVIPPTPSIPTPTPGTHPQYTPSPGIPPPTGIHARTRDLVLGIPAAESDLRPGIPTPQKGPGTSDTHPPWTEWLTDACENITFPQLLLRAVIN